mmetsp:Transcript_24265/g.34727  ORF Transcript_24265/g.34727 Transcript_24265/m.34727 type:complete len:159 (+) Transcript_24265:20-496(+)
MKIFITAAALLIASSDAFAPASFSRGAVITTQRNMFGGSASGLVEEEDPEKQKAMEAQAKAMGMSVDEFQLAMKARERLESDISGFRATGGTDDIGVEMDGNSPPKHLVFKLSESGKAKGKDDVSKEFSAAITEAIAKCKEGRKEATANMIKFIQSNE